MRTRISNLSEELVGEIFSRVPLTSLSAVRCTCKTWNAISKKHILSKKENHQFLEFIVLDSRVCSLRLDLQGIYKEEDFVDQSMKQISIPNSDDQLEISQVCHCDGLLLCMAKDNLTLVVWNPYLGQTKWIRPRNESYRYADSFALGYDNNHNHKIVRFGGPRNGIDVYDFSSDSWRVLDVIPEGDIVLSYRSGVSLKGNTYFFGQVETLEEEAGPRGRDLVIDIEDYLLCFDFTTERFGQRLHLPFNPPYPSFEYFTLSWVRDEKLAVLYNHEDAFETYEIWISTNIEPNDVSWSRFLKLDMTLVNGLPEHFCMDFEARSFFIDEDMKVAVLFDKDTFETTKTYQTAYIFGDDGYFRSTNIGVNSNYQKPGKLVCSSYVPSLVQLQV